MANFGIDLKALCDKYADRLDVVARKTVLDIGTSLVLKSPVGDPALWKHKPPPGYVGGRFRANWQHGFNVTPSGVVDGVDPTGAGSIESIGARIDAQSPSGIHYFANNLPYANALEFGHSTQAPGGMVGLTAAEFEQYVKENAAKVKT